MGGAVKPVLSVSRSSRGHELPDSILNIGKAGRVDTLDPLHKRLPGGLLSREERSALRALWLPDLDSNQGPTG